jgi:hypothetical protein
MMKTLWAMGLIGGLVVGLTGVSLATPSTQIWNPSTDIQARGTWHLGIDDYFTIEDRTSGGYTFPTDLGLTYGILPGIEVGVDELAPQSVPGGQLVLNAKYGIAEAGLVPALAIGGYGFGTLKGQADQNVIYGVTAKTFFLGRLSAGYFQGNSATIGSDNSGVILTWDKAINDKLWACVDYAGGNSILGALFGGLSYSFSQNTSVIFAYGKYNNGAKPTMTTQLDLNF